jgi:hypothetical protein
LHAALASPPPLLEPLPPLEPLLDPLLELEPPPPELLELLLELLLLLELELDPLPPPELLLPEPMPPLLPEPLEAPPSGVVAGLFEHAAAMTIGIADVNARANEVKLDLSIGGYLTTLFGKTAGGSTFPPRRPTGPLGRVCQAPPSGRRTIA